MKLSTLDVTMALGQQVGELLRAGDVVSLTGTLGVGKTSLARGILVGLGFTHDVPSPSFPIVIAYLPPDVRLPVWHVDLYRIERALDVEDLGLEEALIDGALIVEWPELLPQNLRQTSLEMNLEILSDDARLLTAHVPPSWEDRWPIR